MQVCISGSFYSCILTYIDMRYIIKPRRKQIFLHLTIESRYIMKANIRKDMYGYEMIDTLSKRSDNVFELKVGTLYPLLHSMVQSGYLESYNQEANGKLRKYYRITPNGKKYLEKMIEEWNAYANAVTSMIQYSV